MMELWFNSSSGILCQWAVFAVQSGGQEVIFTGGMTAAASVARGTPAYALSSLLSIIKNTNINT